MWKRMVTYDATLSKKFCYNMYDNESRSPVTLYHTFPVSPPVTAVSTVSIALLMVAVELYGRLCPIMAARYV